MATKVPQNPPAYTEAPPQHGYQQPPQHGYQQPPQHGYQPAGVRPMDVYPPPGPQPLLPQGGYYPQAPGYSPAPATFQPGGIQQQTSNNVVVVGQPTIPTVSVAVIPRSNDYMVLTIVMMVICFIHGNLPAFVCLIPALVFASMASERNDAGNYDEARQYGRYALWCNIGTFAYYAVAIVISVILVIVVVATNTAKCSSYDYYC